MTFNWATAKTQQPQEESQSFDWGSSTAVPKVTQTSSMGALAEDQFKQGLVDLAMGVVPDSLMNIIQGRPAVDPAIVVGSPEKRALDAADRATTAQALGLDIQNLQPSNVSESVVANIARAGADPMSYMGGAGPKLSSLVLGPLETIVSTTASTFGIHGAGEAALMLGAEEDGKIHQAVQITAGGISGAAPSTMLTTAARAATAAGKAAYTMKDSSKDVGKMVDEGETYIASKQVANLISDAMSTDPSLAPKVGHVEALMKEFPELKIGPWIAMTENPVLRDNFNYLLRTNPKFHAEIKTQVNDAQKLLEGRKSEIFQQGGYEAELRVYEGLQKSYDEAAQRIKNINKMLEAVAHPADPSKVRTPEEIGKSVTSLVNAKKQAVRTEMAPLYKELFNSAEASGIEFPASSVEAVYNFAHSEMGELFGVMPKEYRQIVKDKWKQVPVRDADGKVVKGEDGKPLMEFPSASVRQLDSLKKSVNEGLRNPNIKGDTRARLENLKGVLDAEIVGMGDFGKAYKGLDYEYWSRLGIPLNQEGIKQISTKKFADQVAPLLSRPEQAREFLGMVGDEGKAVVQSAIFAQLSKKAYNPKTGELDILAVEKFRTDPANRDVLEMSGLSDSLKSTVEYVTRLDEERSGLATQYIAGTQGYTKEFFGRVHENGLDGVINDMLNKPAQAQRHLKFISGLDAEGKQMVMSGLKAEMVSRAVHSGDGAVKFIEDNKNAYSLVFGKESFDNLKSLSEMADIVGAVDLDKIHIAGKHTKLEDFLKRKTGVPLDQVNSLLRDRIMSAHQKMFVFLNKMNSARIDGKEEQMMIELFTKEGAMSELKKQADALKLDPNKPEALKAFADVVNKTFARGAYLGTAAADEERKRAELMMGP